MKVFLLLFLLFNFSVAQFSGTVSGTYSGNTTCSFSGSSFMYWNLGFSSLLTTDSNGYAVITGSNHNSCSCQLAQSCPAGTPITPFETGFLRSRLIDITSSCFAQYTAKVVHDDDASGTITQDTSVARTGTTSCSPVASSVGGFTSSCSYRFTGCSIDIAGSFTATYTFRALDLDCSGADSAVCELYNKRYNCSSPKVIPSKKCASGTGLSMFVNPIFPNYRNLYLYGIGNKGDTYVPNLRQKQDKNNNLVAGEAYSEVQSGASLTRSDGTSCNSDFAGEAEEIIVCPQQMTAIATLDTTNGELEVSVMPPDTTIIPVNADSSLRYSYKQLQLDTSYMPNVAVNDTAILLVPTKDSVTSLVNSDSRISTNDISSLAGEGGSGIDGSIGGGVGGGAGGSGLGIGTGRNNEWGEDLFGEGGVYSGGNGMGYFTGGGGGSGGGTSEGTIAAGTAAGISDVLSGLTSEGADSEGKLDGVNTDVDALDDDYDWVDNETLQSRLKQKIDSTAPDLYAFGNMLKDSLTAATAPLTEAMNKYGSTTIIDFNFDTGIAGFRCSYCQVDLSNVFGLNLVGLVNGLIIIASTITAGIMVFTTIKTGGHS